MTDAADGSLLRGLLTAARLRRFVPRAVRCLVKGVVCVCARVHTHTRYTIELL